MTEDPSGISIAAPAKINLFLHVGARRADGFHDLQSLVVFTAIGDRLEFEPSNAIALRVGGPFARELPAGDDNLVVRAARALADRAGTKRGAAITLTKELPVASGIGGGSTDAAAALKGLKALWQLDIHENELRDLAAGLGSDVPVCIAGRPAWMEGRGERLTPAPPMPELRLVLVNPGIAVPTGAVFAGLEARRGTGMPVPNAFRDVSDLMSFLGTVGNDLEDPACRIAPPIRDVLAALRAAPGALLARMSGSGATCFAIFDSEASSSAAARQLSQTTGWWVRATALAPQ